MDQELFRQAVGRVPAAGGGERTPSGIGTLGEKTLHAVLKHYFEPDTARHEQPVAGYVADIVSDSRVTEIQTRNFDQLQRKLSCFLALTDVTVVYPVAQTKWLVWIDEATGEVTKKRRSPKTGKPYEVFRELYRIRQLLCHPRLSICVVLLELEEYRLLNGWSRDKKKGSSRYDRIPVTIEGDLTLSCPADYATLIPPTLGRNFNSQDFKSASGLTLPAAQTALNVLYAVGAVRRTGKRGNAFVYERSAGG